METREIAFSEIAVNSYIGSEIIVHSKECNSKDLVIRQGILKDFKPWKSLVLREGGIHGNIPILGPYGGIVKITDITGAIIFENKLVEEIIFAEPILKENEEAERKIKINQYRLLCFGEGCEL